MSGDATVYSLRLFVRSPAGPRFWRTLTGEAEAILYGVKVAPLVAPGELLFGELHASKPFPDSGVVRVAPVSVDDVRNSLCG